MIDGIKITTRQRQYADWMVDPNLSFRSEFNERTGELTGRKSFAKCKGLHFAVYPNNPNHSTETCYIQGSLAQYFNDGEHNAFDFEPQQIKTALNRLSTQFKLDLKQCHLHGLEIGFNIRIPIQVDGFLSRIKQLKSSGFASLYKGRKVIGKKIDFQQYSIKLYNKGKQQGTDEKHYLRFEISVKKMQFLKQYGITKLEDLENTEKVRNVALLLTDWLKDAIYYETHIQYRKMTTTEQKKWLYFGNASNWENYNRKQRYNAKAYYDRLIGKYCTHSDRSEIVKMMHEKIEDLTASNMGQFNRQSENITAENMGQFNRLDEQLKRTLNTKNTKTQVDQKKTPKKELKKEQEKGQKKRAKCMVCKTDIKHKRKGTKYCTKKCNNKNNGMKRTQRNRERISREKHHFSKLVNALEKKRLWLWITYKADGVEYSDFLHQNEISTTTDWLKKVIKIRAENPTNSRLKYELSGYMARKLLRIINQTNYVKTKQNA